MNSIDRYRGALMGLAVGDALGTTLEFRSPGSFEPIEDMIGGGPFEEPLGEALDVEHGATNGDDRLTTRVNVADGDVGELKVAGQAEGIARLDHVDEMMRYRPPGLCGRLGRTDVHAAIDLHGIDGDDLAARPAGDFQPDAALATTGTPDEQVDRDGHGRLPNAEESATFRISGWNTPVSPGVH